MQLARKAFKPRETRVQVLPIEIKGLICCQDNHKVPFIVWDVSANGLGILLSDRLESGEVLKLDIGAPFAITVECSVVWCELQEADYDFQEPSFRCGLITVVSKKSLQPIVDCIDEARKNKR